MLAETARCLEKIRAQRPLVHNITNYVVMSYTANALLCLGASPVMAHAVEEVEAMVELADALVINIGTLSAPWVDAMFLASRAAIERSIPVVLDPVGAGATAFRTDTARRLLDEFGITVLRGNASEIMALAGLDSTTRGVDSVHATAEARSAAVELANVYKAVVAVTGAEDFITNGPKSARVANGHPLMGRVSGTGCVASSIVAAFCAVQPDPLVAATAGLSVLGIAGELAARDNPGPGTFQRLLLDALDAMESRNIEEKGRIAVSWEQ